MLTWLFYFVLAAIGVCIVIYVCKLLLAQIELGEPVRSLVLLLIAIGVLIFIVRYLGMPPMGAGP